MVVTLSGMVTLVRLLSSNAESPMVVTLSANGHAGEAVALESDSSMVVTLSGMVTLVRLLSANAEFPMVVTLSGMVTLVRLLVEASAPMLVTL